ncbi:toxin biosynthesis protein [Halenospora varia]|nr:toxin biosynthesis protein [Halenospora varia]
MNNNLANKQLKGPDSSIIPHILLWFVQIIALASPPFLGRRAIFSVWIILLAIYCNLHPYFTNDFALAQPFSIAWSFYMATLAKLLFSGPQGPESQFWRIDKPAKEAHSYPGFSWRKIRWAAVLMFNQRGVRWSHQVKNVPELPKMSKSRFLAIQLSKFVGCACAADILFEIHRRVNFTTPDGQVGEINSKYLTLRHSDLTWSLVKTFSFGALPYFMLSMQYAQGAFLAVLLGISKPEDWPSAFGSFEETKTIRSFWGAFWHQQLRHMLTSYTDAFANMLKIPRGTNLSSYTKLYLAFLLSGTFHSLGQLHLPRSSNITAGECAEGFFLFFVWQAAAITAEDFAKWIVRKNGWSPQSNKSKRYCNMIGHAWVFFSMWMSFPIVGDTMLRMRIGTGQFAPFPLMRPLVEAYVPIPQ